MSADLTPAALDTIETMLHEMRLPLQASNACYEGCDDWLIASPGHEYEPVATVHDGEATAKCIARVCNDAARMALALRVAWRERDDALREAARLQNVIDATGGGGVQR